MAIPNEVSLDVATLQDAPLLSNLLQLYIHDMSEAFPGIELGADGRYPYEWLPLYWSEPERRFPFVIRVEGGAAGFALVMRGSEGTGHSDVFDIAELFVLRGHRRSGVGRRAAFLLWNRFPGPWTVRVSEGNPGGLRFWTAVVGEYTQGAAIQSERAGNPNRWRLFSFDSAR